MELTSGRSRRVFPGAVRPNLASAGAGVVEWLARRTMVALTSRLAREGSHRWAPGDPRGRAVAAVTAGLRLALATSDRIGLPESLGAGDPRDAGFRHEGAAMGCALLDIVTCANLRRWNTLREACGAHHDYLLHVGLGLALARIRRADALPIAGTDPLLGALAIDGAGFYAGYFRPAAPLAKLGTTSKPSDPLHRIRDQGLGRSLWFTRGTDASALAATIYGCAESRRPALWSGVGLACAYAGGSEAEGLHRLLEEAAEHVDHLAQGVAFAAEARVRADNVIAATEEACRIVCGCSAAVAAEAVRACRGRATGAPDGSAYEDWRSRVRAELRARGRRT